MSNIYNVGICDGDISYNSYLIKAKKNVLIDTVPSEFSDMLIKNIEKHLSVDELNYIIINHTSYERCSALKDLLLKNSQITVISTIAGLKNIQEQLNCDFLQLLAKSNMTLELDEENILRFLITHNIDWPDSMMTYHEGQRLLFSCDAFSFEGKDADLWNYYNDNLSHMSDYVNSAMKILENLLIKRILPGSGGAVSDCNNAIQDYTNWSNEQKNDAKTVSVIYYSKSGNTLSLAKRCKKINPKINIYDASKFSKEELLEVVYKSDGVIFACPTENRNIPFVIAQIIISINHFKIKNKLFAAFGSYGWSGEAPNLIYSILRARHFHTYQTPFRYMFVPTDEDLENFDKYICSFYEKLINI